MQSKIVKLKLGTTKVKMIHTDTISRHGDSEFFYKWFSSTDQLTQLYHISKLPPKYKSILGVKKHHQFAIPIKKMLFQKELTAILLVPSANETILSQLQLLAILTGYKTDISRFTSKVDHFMKYYHFGQICHEIFHEINNNLVFEQTLNPAQLVFQE